MHDMLAQFANAAVRDDNLLMHQVVGEARGVAPEQAHDVVGVPTRMADEMPAETR
jgi:hypothetical protein